MVKTEVLTNHILLPNKSQMSPNAAPHLVHLPAINLFLPSLCGDFLCFPVTWPWHLGLAQSRSVDPGNMQLYVRVGLSGGNLHIFYLQGAS